MNAAIDRFFDARFGLFIHWGLYSLLGGEWQGQRMYDDIGEWIMSYHKIPVRTYEKLAEQFNPTAFDADAIARLAKDAGMRYLVITSKHHEGFALFHSRADAYNVVDATPFGRDIIAELAVACRRHGLKFGLYYSQALDWHERDAGGWDDPAYLPVRRPWGNIWDFPDPTGKNFEAYFTRKVLPQVRELLTQYGDIFLLWFDTPITISKEQSKRLYDLVKSLQPQCLVNSRIGNGMGDYESLGDNLLPTIPLSIPAESPVTMNDTWGYKSYDNNWKSSRDIIGKLARLAGKNANLLLNIGPRGDGSVPEDCVRVLQEVGQWTRAHEEAIYGTRGNPFRHDLPWGSITARSDKLYCFLDNSRQSQLTLNGLNNQACQVVSLCDGHQLPFSQEPLNESTSLTVGLRPTDDPMPVYRIDLDGPPDCSKQVYMQDGGRLQLYPHLAQAQMDGETISLNSQSLGQRYKKSETVSITSAGTLVAWQDPRLTLSWEAWISRSGRYAIKLQLPVQYNQAPHQISHQLRLTVKNNGYEQSTLWLSVLENGAAEADKPFELQQGPCRFTLTLQHVADGQKMSLQHLDIAPVE